MTLGPLRIPRSLAVAIFVAVAVIAAGAAELSSSYTFTAIGDNVTLNQGTFSLNGAQFTITIPGGPHTVPTGPVAATLTMDNFAVTIPGVPPINATLRLNNGDPANGFIVADNTTANSFFDVFFEIQIDPGPDWIDANDAPLNLKIYPGVWVQQGDQLQGDRWRVQVVPEPLTLALLAGGMLVGSARLRRR